jgi:hypothetical protein
VGQDAACDSAAAASTTKTLTTWGAGLWDNDYIESILLSSSKGPEALAQRSVLLPSVIFFRRPFWRSQRRDHPSTSLRRTRALDTLAQSTVNRDTLTRSYWLSM